MGNVTEEEHVQDETVFKVQVKLYIPAMSLDISTEVTGETSTATEGSCGEIEAKVVVV